MCIEYSWGDIMKEVYDVNIRSVSDKELLQLLKELLLEKVSCGQRDGEKDDGQ